MMVRRVFRSSSLVRTAARCEKKISVFRSFVVSQRCIHYSSPLAAEDSGRPAPPENVQKIIDSIMALNVFEVTTLVTELKDKFGYVEAAPMMMQASATAEKDDTPEEAVQEQTVFAVKLKGFDAKKKIAVIKEVRSLCGLGLKEAKDLVESVPAVVKKDMAKEDAEALLKKLESVGGEAAME